MSSRLHQSSVLVEHPASPPHLLSPDLLPAVPYPAPSEIPHQASDQQTIQPEPNVEQHPSTMNTLEEVHAPHVDNAESQPPAVVVPLIDEGVSVGQINVESSTEAPGSDESNQEVTETHLVTNDLAERVVAEHTLSTDALPSIENQAVEHNAETQNTDTSDDAPSISAPEAEPIETSIPPPPEHEPEIEQEDNTPSWVRWEEDLSVPDEEEMKEIEGSEYDKLSATHVNSMEAQFYSDLDDPEQRPAKKLRLSWVVKGVRGTKEKPNMARVMNSPAVCVDGLYWSIKFYPRGDNCTSLSAFVRCSRNPPKQVEEMPEHTFAFYEGPPDADFGDNYEPKVKVSAPNTQRVREERKPKKKQLASAEATKKTEDDDESDESAREVTPREPESSDRRDDEEDDATDATDDAEDKNLPDWRVSAQLGMAIYNPTEPRTGHLQSDGHQFSKHCDDWGWVNFVGPWDEIHKRKRGQRQPLLRDDCLAIDAYVRIYDDPTQALWWHDSKTESQWPSKQLAGYYPMGTPQLYHSPAVAGISAWSLLAPFRDILQTADGGQWRRDSSFHPKPLICQSQLVLHQMRALTNECYVNVFKVVEELTEADEPWEDVKSFWEVYRRGLELEFAGDEEALKKFANIFDADGKAFKMLSVPVPGETDTASGIAKCLNSQKFNGALPNFLPIMLNRQQFDKEKREWKLCHNRVQLSDELDLSEWTTDNDGKFTLYGFIAHVGARNSGKFYTVLRPNGIGTKWLAFEDGNGNKVFSYTKKRVEEFEGLEGDELKEFTGTRENAYMAMYVRNSRWNEYLLPEGLEPYKLPKWLRGHSDGQDELTEAEKIEEEKRESDLDKKQESEGITVEIYLDEYVKGHDNVLDLHDIRTTPMAKEYCQTIKVATDKTYRELRQKIAEALDLSDATKIGLWEMSYRTLGKFSRAELDTVADHRSVERDVRAGEPFRMWLSILEPAEGRSSYKDLLPKIGEMGLEIQAPILNPVPDQTDEERKDGDAPTDGPGDTLPTSDLSATEANLLVADTSSSHTDDSNTTGIATPATGATGDSAADVEQASVETAVAMDIENASAAQENTQTIADATPTPPLSHDQPSQMEDTAVTPTQEQNSSEANAPALPVEHGHMVEAAVPTNNALDTPTESIPADPVSTTVLQVSDQLSAEDAAAIAAVLAADAEDSTTALTEQPIADRAQFIDGTWQSSNEGAVLEHAESGDSLVDPVPASRVPTPQPIQHVYVFIHTFDPEGQRFVAQKPFNPEVEQEIGPALRKALGYGEDKDFRIWKREGPSGTVPVTTNFTFSALNFQDGFSLIVGDTLSDSKIEDLKQEGKFWMPAQLIKYLHTARRGHPVLSKTTDEPVEVAEFGGDYFKGPLVNGQPHGKDCTVITSSGHTYEGPMIAGLKSGGKGKMTFQNGDLYVGGWLNDERHGQGEHTEARTGNRYVGGFENGKRWGEGVTYWKVADDQAAMCQICYGEEIDALFYDCGHVCACVECAKQCETCPICRKSVRHVVRMYRA